MADDKNEPQAANPLDVIDAGRWRRAVFTTFTLSLGFFEAYVLPRLHRAGCDDITILVDEAFYIASLAESGARHIGTAYRVHPVAIRDGVFHAKLMYLWHEHGDDVFMVGSGNVTWSGFGHNLECLEVLEGGRDSAAFADLASILQALLSRDDIRFGDCKRLQEITERSAKVAARRSQRQTGARLIASVTSSISEQVASALAPYGPFDRVVVMSPFHSPDAGPALRIASRLGCARAEIAIDAHTESTPVLPNLRGISFVRREAANDSRPTHAKWFEFIGARSWVLTGSANATETSFESIKNFEVSVLRPAAADLLGRWSSVVPARTGVSPPEIAPGSADMALTLAMKNAGAIRGEFVGQCEDVDGTWTGFLLRHGAETQLHEIRVAGAQFQCRVPEDVELDEYEPCQFVLARRTSRASGWIMFESQLDMSREEREFARKVRRLTAPDADDEDFLSVLSWLAERVGQIVAVPMQSVAESGNKRTEDPPAPTGPFDYAKWAARTAASEHGAVLGACRAAFDALAKYAARPAQSTVGVGSQSERPRDFDSAGDPDDAPTADGNGSTEPGTVGLSFNTLKHGIERALERVAEQETLTFLLEALLWVLILIDRSGARPTPLDALPFTQWSAYAKSHTAKVSVFEPLAEVTLAAMSCAFAMRVSDEPRTESFAVLARQAMRALGTEEAASVVRRTIEGKPCFSKLTEGQVAAAVAAVPALLHYQGFADQLHDFLVRWSAGGAVTDGVLSANTGGVIEELRWRRGMNPPYLEWIDKVPDRCAPKCYNGFDASDRAVLRNRRALKCNRCGLLHFWTGAT